MDDFRIKNLAIRKEAIRNFKSNDGKNWQLQFYPEEGYLPAPYYVLPGTKKKFVARFTQDCAPQYLSVFNEEGLKLFPDFEFKKRYSINERMKFVLEVENVSEIKRIFDAVLFAEIFMKR